MNKIIIMGMLLTAVCTICIPVRAMRGTPVMRQETKTTGIPAFSKLPTQQYYYKSYWASCLAPKATFMGLGYMTKLIVDSYYQNSTIFNKEFAIAGIITFTVGAIGWQCKRYYSTQLYSCLEAYNKQVNQTTIDSVSPEESLY